MIAFRKKKKQSQQHLADFSAPCPPDLSRESSLKVDAVALPGPLGACKHSLPFRTALTARKGHRAQHRAGLAMLLLFSRAANPLLTQPAPSLVLPQPKPRVEMMGAPRGAQNIPASAHGQVGLPGPLPKQLDLSLHPGGIAHPAALINQPDHQLG